MWHDLIKRADSDRHALSHVQNSDTPRRLDDWTWVDYSGICFEDKDQPCKPAGDLGQGGGRECECVCWWGAGAADNRLIWRRNWLTHTYTHAQTKTTQITWYTCVQAMLPHSFWNFTTLHVLQFDVNWLIKWSLIWFTCIRSHMQRPSISQEREGARSDCRSFLFAFLFPGQV